MNDHRYILKPYKTPASRNTCPSCGHKRKFSRYIDASCGEELADHVGRCDRENNCGYHFTPKQYFAEVGSTRPGHPPEVTLGNHGSKTISYLPFELMEKSVMRHRQCDLYPFLASIFGEDPASVLCTDYFIGASKEGNTAFWQVDTNGIIRQCKVIQYLPDGHRDKTKTIIFAGKKILSDQDANLKQCFFGEYLLSMDYNEGKPVAICESEKTAV